MVSARDQFSLYDIGCAALVLLPLIITAGIIAVGLMMLVYPVSATVLRIYPTSDNGVGQQTANETWANLRAAAGSEVSKASNINYAPRLGVSSTTATGKYFRFTRLVQSYNVSAIPDDAVITNVTWFLGRTFKATDEGTPSFGATGGTLADNTTVAFGDYDAFGSTEYITRVNYTAIGTSPIFYLNAAGIAAIDKTGFFVLYGRDSWDLDNDPTGIVWSGGSTKYTQLQVYSVTSTTEAYRPYINITYITPPVSSFTASNQTPCSSDTVQFNDTSTNTPTAWDWRWWSNETTSSTSQNPTYQFPPGLYNVRLYASNADGGDWENKTGFINSTDCTPPITSLIDASFTSNVTCGNIPFTVQFNDTSTGSPTTWNWSFGTGGNYSGLQNPVFEYNTSGLFTINFSANNGNTDWMNRSGYIRAVPNWANCPPTPTPMPTWGPEIMPSTDNEIASPSWVDYMISLWWIWLLLIVGYILVKK
jgi:PKD repeat protein